MESERLSKQCLPSHRRAGYLNMLELCLRQFRPAVLIALLMPAASAMAMEQPAYNEDETSGLIMAPGWETVKGHCTACHSARVITTQRGDRATWESIVRWMQRTQGLWQFPGEVETTILNYLATNYPPGKPSRRPNLSVYLLPE